MTIASLSDMLRGSAFGAGLGEAELCKLEQETFERSFAAGAVVCHKHTPALHWLGVVEGMVKVDTVSADGRMATFIGVSAGGWLGEGSLLKKELRPYEVVALHDSRVAFMPRATFEWLLSTSLPFNRFLIDNLNARLGQFVALVESYRIHDVAARVAHCLAELLNPQLSPAAPQLIAISQEEVGRLSGLSRQIANRALHQLEQAGLVHVGYGTIDVRNVEGLRLFARTQ